MAQFSACRTFSQNLFFGGKNKLIGATPIKGKNTPSMLYALTLATALAPAVISALFFMTKYLENDLQ